MMFILAFPKAWGNFTNNGYESSEARTFFFIIVIMVSISLALPLIFAGRLIIENLRRRVR